MYRVRLIAYPDLIMLTHQDFIGHLLLVRLTDRPRGFPQCPTVIESGLSYVFCVFILFVCDVCVAILIMKITGIFDQNYSFSSLAISGLLSSPSIKILLILGAGS